MRKLKSWLSAAFSTFQRWFRAAGKVLSTREGGWEMLVIFVCLALVTGWLAGEKYTAKQVVTRVRQVMVICSEPKQSNTYRCPPEDGRVVLGRWEDGTARSVLFKDGEWFLAGAQGDVSVLFPPRASFPATWEEMPSK